MNSNTVNISFRKDLLRQIDKIAKEEFRSRSELIREAARMYIERKSRWNTIFCLGGDLAKKRAWPSPTWSLKSRSIGRRRRPHHDGGRFRFE